MNAKEFRLIGKTLLLGLAVIASSAVAAPPKAAPGPIYGTYMVTDTKTCAYAPWRAAAAPAYFANSTASNLPYGLVQVPAGTTYTDASNGVWRGVQTDAYQLVINPINNTVSATNGAFHQIPLIVIGTTPPYIAQFGTFTGSGSFTTTTGSPFIDVSLQTLALTGDGVTQVQNTPSSGATRLRTQDNGASFVSIAGRGVITLQFNVATNLYRDVVCSSAVLGQRISTAY